MKVLDKKKVLNRSIKAILVAIGIVLQVIEPGRGDEVTRAAETASDIAISGDMHIEEKKTRQPPTGKITLGESEWTEFSGSVKFDTLLAGEQTVVLEGEDETSEVRSIEYYLSNESLVASGVAAISVWTIYKEPFIISPTNSYIIYVKITNNAGNETVINSGGLVLYTAINSDDGSYKNQESMTDKGINLEFNTVTKVTEGNAMLAKDKDYVINDDGTLTLTDSYVEALGDGSHKLEITYTPSTTNDSEKMLTVEITFEVEKRISDDDTYKNQDNITGDGIDTKGSTVTAVKVDGETLTEGKDYVIDDNTLTLTDSYIETLADGSHEIEITYIPSTTAEGVTPPSQKATIKFEVEPRINPDDYPDMNQNDVGKVIGSIDGTVVEVKVNGKVLKEGDDYVIAYGNVKFTDAFIKTLTAGTYTMETSYRSSTTDPNVEASVRTVTLTFTVESSKAESSGTESGEADTTDKSIADATADSEQDTTIGSQGGTNDDEDGGAGTGGQGNTGGDSDEAESQVEEDSTYSSAPDTEYPVDEEESAGTESAKGNQFIIGACVFGLVALSMMMLIIVLWKRRKKEKEES